MDNLSSRPLLAKGDPLVTLQNLHERFDDYAQADIIIDTNGLSLRQSLEKILARLADDDMAKDKGKI